MEQVKPPILFGLLHFCRNGGSMRDTVANTLSAASVEIMKSRKISSATSKSPLNFRDGAQSVKSFLTYIDKVLGSTKKKFGTEIFSDGRYNNHTGLTRSTRGIRMSLSARLDNATQTGSCTPKTERLSNRYVRMLNFQARKHKMPLNFTDRSTLAGEYIKVSDLNTFYPGFQFRFLDTTFELEGIHPYIGCFAAEISSRSELDYLHLYKLLFLDQEVEKVIVSVSRLKDKMRAELDESILQGGCFNYVKVEPAVTPPGA